MQRVLSAARCERCIECNARACRKRCAQLCTARYARYGYQRYQVCARCAKQSNACAIDPVFVSVCFAQHGALGGNMFSPSSIASAR
eukprot:1146018-Lingulodinium_polyedra.AAC.1